MTRRSGAPILREEKKKKKENKNKISSQWIESLYNLFLCFFHGRLSVELTTDWTLWNEAHDCVSATRGKQLRKKGGTNDVDVFATKWNLWASGNLSYCSLVQSEYT